MFGRVNTLAPIVAMPFMLTYAMVDYAYFALAMSFDKRKARENRFKEAQDLPATFDTTHKLNGSAGQPPRDTGGYGSIAAKSSDDLDSLFPERRQHEDGRSMQLPRRPSLGSQTDVGLAAQDVKSDGKGDGKSDAASVVSEPDDDTHGLLKKGMHCHLTWGYIFTQGLLLKLSGIINVVLRQERGCGGCLHTCSSIHCSSAQAIEALLP